MILALLAVLGIGAPVLTTTKGAALSAGATPSVSVAATHSTVSSSQSAAELLEKFLGTSSARVNENNPWRAEGTPSAADRALLQADARSQFAISFLIETVPAAMSASLRHEFDSYVNAIQMAAGRAGYVLDSFDLPWLEQGGDHQGEFRLAQPIDLDWNRGLSR